MGIESALQKIHQAGFRLALNGDSLTVDPGDRLTDQQRQFLKVHKPEIIAALSQPGTVLESDQGGHDLPPANDPDDRVTVRVPSLTLANGREVSCDLSVPVSRIPELEKVLKVERKSPSVLPPGLVHAALAACKAYGDSKADQDALFEDLSYNPPEEYPALLEHFRAKLIPVRCMDCHHAEVSAGIAKRLAGVDSQLPIKCRWATDLHICPHYSKPRDSPETEEITEKSSIVISE